MEAMQESYGMLLFDDLQMKSVATHKLLGAGKLDQVKKIRDKKLSKRDIRKVVV
jgi:hypothetical protein